MKKILISGGAALIAMSLLSSCQGTKNDGALTADEQEMQAITSQYVNKVIYLIYGELANTTSDLYEKLADLTDKFESDANSITQSEIDEICSVFLTARSYWEKSEAFLFGAATFFSIDPHIDTWPLDRKALATSLSNAKQVEELRGEDGIAYAGGKLGEELLGFHGVEFILFRDGKNRTVAQLKAKEDNEDFAGVNVTGLQELIYATAVAGDLRNKCYQLEVSWNADAPKEHIEVCEDCEYNTTIGDKSFGEDILNATKAGSTYATMQSVMTTILVSGCSNIANEVANTKMGSAHTGEDVNYIESPYSKNSFVDFENNIHSIEYSLNGAENAVEPAAHSLMKYLNDNYSGASALKAALDDSIAKLKICQSKGHFVDIYKDACVQDAMDAINELDAQLNKASAWIALR